MPNKAADIIKLIAAIAISQFAGVIGSIFTMSSINTWYRSLEKPPFNPPSWVFAPVWITLYTLMGIAAWLVWRRGLANPSVKVALSLFLIQLMLNVTWTWIFFGNQAIYYAFIEILVLWLAILLTIIWFFKVSRLAGALLIPYIIWVSFAAVLNYSIWQLNR